MMLNKISLVNFANFYGKHTLQFEKHLNIVEGPGASGKTNLARAVGFAVYGCFERHFTRIRCPRADLVNHVHRKESEDPFCEVKARASDEKLEVTLLNCSRLISPICIILLMVLCEIPHTSRRVSSNNKL